LKNVQVQRRIVQLQQKVARKAEITLESLLHEAETQRLAALAANQHAAANGALKLKAELSGGAEYYAAGVGTGIGASAPSLA
jgi:hypothetical protein